VSDATRARWTRAQRAKNDAIYALVRAALAVAGVIPRAALAPLGALLGWIAWALAGGARRRAIENVRRGLPAHASPHALVRAVFVELGRLLGDTIALLRADESPTRTLAFDAAAQATLAAAREEGRGVILVTAHLGPWERLAAVLVTAGFPLTTPVRASYDPRLEHAVHARLRGRFGVRALDRDAKTTPMALVRALRRGEVVGFLIDLNTRVASVRVPFLGVPAWTPSGPARLALRTGAAVVVAIATREGVTIERVRGAAAARSEVGEDEVTALTAELSTRLSAAIEREPERWIWMHDRFGDRRGIGSAIEGANEATKGAAEAEREPTDALAASSRSI
jgi:KDO2-lipid IV(A) lauroyltransferase